MKGRKLDREEVIELNKYLRKKILKKKRQELNNKEFSLIANNCNGCFISHDLGLRFNSPTVNLYFNLEDYIKFLSNIKYYLSLELKEKKYHKYPKGILGDIELKFVHYSSFEEGKKKWEERSKRIDFNNLFILSTDQDGCTYSLIKKFDELPFKNKVMLTNKKYNEFKSTYFINGFEEKDSVGFLFEYKGITGKVYYDDFNFVEWFNKGK